MKSTTTTTLILSTIMTSLVHEPSRAACNAPDTKEPLSVKICSSAAGGMPHKYVGVGGFKTYYAVVYREDGTTIYTGPGTYTWYVTIGSTRLALSPYAGGDGSMVHANGLIVSSDAGDVTIKVVFKTSTDPVPCYHETKLTVVDLAVVDYIKSYYANSESDVPFVVEPKPTCLGISPADYTLFELTFRTDVDGAQIDLSAPANLKSGNAISGTTVQPPITALIPEAFYQPIMTDIGVCDISKYKVEWELTIGGETVFGNTGEKNAERFGDARIPVYEIGVGSTANGTYPLSGAPNPKKAANLLQYATNSTSGATYDLPDAWTYFRFEEFHVDKPLDEIDKFTLRSRYKTDYWSPYFTGMYAWHIRTSLSEERRQSWAAIYYGKKTWQGVRVVDITQADEDVNFGAFPLETPGATKFKFIWGQGGYGIESGTWDPSVLQADSLLLDAFALGASLASPWSKAKLAFLLLDSLSFGISAKASIEGSKTFLGGDWAGVVAYGGFKVRDKDGNTRLDKYCGTYDNSIAEVRKIQGGTRAEEAATDEEWLVPMRDASWSQKVYVGDSFDGFVSGSIKCGSYAGGMWLILWHELDVDVSLKCDLSSDPNLYLSTFP